MAPEEDSVCEVGIGRGAEVVGASLVVWEATGPDPAECANYRFMRYLRPTYLFSRMDGVNVSPTNIPSESRNRLTV